MLFVRMLASLLGLMICSQVNAAGTLRVLIVADTNDDKIGAGVAANVGQLEELFSRIKAAGVTVATTKVDGAKFKCSAIREAAEGLTVDSDDVVLFHYSGHGSLGPSQLPQFNCKEPGATLGLEDVKGIIEGKNPKLKVLVADTCNKELHVFGPGPVFYGKIPVPKAEEKNTWEAGMKQLFADYKGSVIFLAAKPNFEAYYRTGYRPVGYFTAQWVGHVAAQALFGTAARWQAIVDLTLEFKTDLFYNQYPIGLPEHLDPP